MHNLEEPRDRSELIKRLDSLAGIRIGELAAHLGIEVPENLRRHKGWVGQLLEMALGTSAGNKAVPDFERLQIELKTLPVNPKGVPSESTYVCVVPLNNLKDVNWESSVVRHKLSHVLWLPIEASKEIPLIHRRIGQGFLWKPDEQTERQLKRDFDEFMEQIVLGEIESITAHQGEFLQIRPKAANASALTEGIGEQGKIRTLPRGFYLRAGFTRRLLEEHRRLA